ncbi:MAG TPA: hypothetical protein PLA41_02545 [Candidatus Pacearchaeota archaeon]|mgnify:CR=1 FL=1|nr:hypothetical protein [Candidatus Pacearchaeota archaeon]HQI74699.1 hypothetical protein [Candidatus Pacearchaeota archaeon]
MDSKNANKKNLKEYFQSYWQQVLLLLILIFWYLKCRIIPWWFWLIFILILVFWSIQKNKKIELQKILKSNKI